MLITAVVTSVLFTPMKAPVERPVASATYGFVRFIGGGLAPFVAGQLAEHLNTHIPFLLGAVAVLVAALVLSTVHHALDAADRGEIAQPELTDLDRSEDQDAMPEAMTIGNAD
jgi:ACDE family multidrug resistance protein